MPVPLHSIFIRLKRPQYITILAGLVLTAGIYFFFRITPKTSAAVPTGQHGPGDGHNHDAESSAVTIDTILILAKKQLNPDQVVRLNTLENSISRGNVNEQQLHVYHQLARFWADSAHIFEPYAWYMAEAARLENSEKNLTFAAQLFLNNLQNDETEQRRRWKALQAKDLFERSLIINPANDSAKIGLGACYLFGNFSDAPMQGIAKILEVVDRDSTNVYGQMTLAKGSLISGQYEKAVSRLETVNRLKPRDIDVLLLLADTNERLGRKPEAIAWYAQCLQAAKEPELKNAIIKRVAELKN